MRQIYTEWLSAARVAEELEIDPGKVRSWPEQMGDPLPVYYPPGNNTQWRVNRQDLNDWIRRNWRDGAWKRQKNRQRP